MTPNQVIHLLLKDPANDRCFKCKVCISEWVSVTLAVFLCTGCAQELRSIDNKRMKIKSLLEKLSPTDLDCLMVGGNHAFTEFLNQYAASVPLSQLVTEYTRILAATAGRQHLKKTNSPGGVIQRLARLFQALGKKRPRYLRASFKESTARLTATVLREEATEINH